MTLFFTDSEKANVAEFWLLQSYSICMNPYRRFVVYVVLNRKFLNFCALQILGEMTKAFGVEKRA